MYQVSIVKTDNKGEEKLASVLMKTEKLYELLGRMLFKYGEPISIVDISHGTGEYEFSKPAGKGFEGMVITFIKYNEKKSSPIQVAPVSQTVHAPPPDTSLNEPLDERLKELIDKNLLSK